MDDRDVIEARITAFIQDHAEWEQDCVTRQLLDGCSPPCPCEIMDSPDPGALIESLQASSPDRSDEARRGLEAVARRHCTSPDLLTRSGFCYGSPLQHDPAAEHITALRIWSGTATVVTTVVGGVGAGFEYELVCCRSDWRIDHITRFHTAEGAAEPADWDEAACVDEFSPWDECGIDFREAFQAGGRAFNAESRKEEALTLVRLGEIPLPSGLLVVSDPGEFVDAVAPLEVRVGRARCPVDVVRAGRENAFIRVLFGDWASVAGFVPAHLLGTEAAYAASSRGGSLVIGDAGAWAALPGRDRERFYYMLVERPGERQAEEATLMALPAAAGEAAIVNRGGGDFDCPCYWAVDSAGRAQALVVDLSICERSVDQVFEIPVTERLLTATVTHPQLSEFGHEIRFERCGSGLAVVSASRQGHEVDLLDGAGRVLGSTEGAGMTACGEVEERTIMELPDDLRGLRLRVRWSERRHVFAREFDGLA